MRLFACLKPPDHVGSTFLFHPVYQSVFPPVQTFLFVFTGLSVLSVAIPTFISTKPALMAAFTPPVLMLAQAASEAAVTVL